MFSFSEAAVIISRESGSRTIVYNPGNQEPLNASEFALAFERSQSSFHWIHFEARPFVHDMLTYLLSDYSNTTISGLFFATAFLNEQIMMAGGRKKRDLSLEDITEKFVKSHIDDNSISNGLRKARDYGGGGCECCSGGSNYALPLLLGALALAAFFLNMVLVYHIKQD